MKKTPLLLIIIIFLSSCKAFMYGFTEDLAFNAYYLVKNEKKDFGTRRIKYNMGLHKHTELDHYLMDNGNPDFIHEFETNNKCDVIELFYLKKDSVYIFEELNNNNPRSSMLKIKRPINESEYLTFKKLTNEL